MFKIIKNFEIHMTRGDTGHLTISVLGQNGLPYTLVSGDIIYFTVKQTIESAIVLQKTSTDGTFTINPSNTSSLPFGCYVYDVCLVTHDGEVNTIIEPSLFELCGEVT